MKVAIVIGKDDLEKLQKELDEINEMVAIVRDKLWELKTRLDYVTAGMPMNERELRKCRHRWQQEQVSGVWKCEKCGKVKLDKAWW